MFRLQHAKNHADALAARLFAKTDAKIPVYVSQETLQVTERCVPARRRRQRKRPATGASEPLRSTWF